MSILKDIAARRQSFLDDLAEVNTDDVALQKIESLSVHEPELFVDFAAWGEFFDGRSIEDKAFIGRIKSIVGKIFLADDHELNTIMMELLPANIGQLMDDAMRQALHEGDVNTLEQLKCEQGCSLSKAICSFFLYGGKIDYTKIRDNEAIEQLHDMCMNEVQHFPYLERATVLENMANYQDLWNNISPKNLKHFETLTADLDVETATNIVAYARKCGHDDFGKEIQGIEPKLLEYALEHGFPDFKKYAALASEEQRQDSFEQNLQFGNFEACSILLKHGIDVQRKKNGKDLIVYFQYEAALNDAAQKLAFELLRKGSVLGADQVSAIVQDDDFIDVVSILRRDPQLAKRIPDISNPKSLLREDTSAFLEVAAYASHVIKGIDELCNDGTYKDAKKLSLEEKTELYKKLLGNAKGGWVAMRDNLASQFSFEDADNVKDALKEFTQSVVLPNIISASMSSDQCKEAVELMMPEVASAMIGERSLSTLLGVSKAWHDHYAEVDAARTVPREGQWTAVVEKPFESQGCTLSFLTDAQQLRDEGRRLKHCVGSYVVECVSGSSHIASIRDKEGKSLATIEFAEDISQGKPMLRIVQKRSYDDATPKFHSPEMQCLSDFMKAINKGEIKLDFNETTEKRLALALKIKNDRDVVSQMIGFNPYEDIRGEGAKKLYDAYKRLHSGKKIVEKLINDQGEEEIKITKHGSTRPFLPPALTHDTVIDMVDALEGSALDKKLEMLRMKYIPKTHVTEVENSQHVQCGRRHR